VLGLFAKWQTPGNVKTRRAHEATWGAGGACFLDPCVAVSYCRKGHRHERV